MSREGIRQRFAAGHHALPVPENRIRLFWANTAEIAAHADQLLPVIPAEYAERCRRQTHPLTAAQTLAAGWLLSEILGLGPADPLVRGPYGKPLPQPGGPHWNLSHSGPWVVLAVSAEEIGVDTEQVGPVRWAAARRLFPEAWIRRLEQTPTERQPERFTELWTSCEAILKLRGTGFSQGLQQLPETHGAVLYTDRWEGQIVSCASWTAAEVTQERMYFKT